MLRHQEAYIIPTLLENELKQSRFIEQVMVVGESENACQLFSLILILSLNGQQKNN